MKKISREEQKRETEKLIIQAGIRVFSKNGITSSKTLDVAKAAGLSHGAVFVHFHTKQDLIVGVIRDIERSILDKLSEILRPEMTLKELLFGYLDVIEGHEVIYSRLVTESSFFPEEVRNILFFIHSALTFYLHKVVAAETKKGKMKSIPQALLFNSWISLIHYYLAHREMFAPHGSVIRERRVELVEHFINLVRK